MCIFHDFRPILGVSWGSLWAPFCDFSVIWGAKVGDCLQVHVFGDPGMEMMPECNGCMCHKHGKKKKCPKGYPKSLKRHLTSSPTYQFIEKVEKVKPPGTRYLVLGTRYQVPGTS